MGEFGGEGLAGMIWDILGVLGWIVGGLVVFIVVWLGIFGGALIWKTNYKLKRVAYLRGESPYNPDKTESSYLAEPKKPWRIFGISK